MPLGTRIRTLRHSRGWYLRDLAARADMETSKLSQVERNMAFPGVEKLWDLAAAFDMAVVEFLEGVQRPDRSSRRRAA